MPAIIVGKDILGPGLVEAEPDSDDSEDEKRRKNMSRVMMTDYRYHTDLAEGCLYR